LIFLNISVQDHEYQDFAVSGKSGRWFMHNVMQQSNLYRAEVTKYSQFRKMEGNMAHVSELGFDFMNVIEKFQIKFTTYKIKLTTFVFTFVAAVA